MPFAICHIPRPCELCKSSAVRGLGVGISLDSRSLCMFNILGKYRGDVGSKCLEYNVKAGLLNPVPGIFIARLRRCPSYHCLGRHKRRLYIEVRIGGELGTMRFTPESTTARPLMLKWPHGQRLELVHRGLGPPELLHQVPRCPTIRRRSIGLCVVHEK